MSTPNESPERTLYETIVEIPHYQCKKKRKKNQQFAFFSLFYLLLTKMLPWCDEEKRVSYLLDKEDEETVVEDSFEGFQQMYKPLIENNSNFKDMMEIRDGKFFIDNECKATQRALLMHINDNVYKNLEKFSIRLFD